ELLRFTPIAAALFCQWPRAAPDLPSFPTRRSSDLAVDRMRMADHRGAAAGTSGLRVSRSATDLEHARRAGQQEVRGRLRKGIRGDRKSTRLNSSHVKISYAVFCLKKKTSQQRA